MSHTTGTGIRRVGNFAADCSGSMTVEFVATVPLLLAALIFSFEFGRALWAYDVMTRDVRAGVRYLSRAQNDVAGTCPAATQNLTKTGLTAGVQSDAHFPWKDTWATATFSCTKTLFASGFNQAVNVVTMQVDVPMTLSLLDFLGTATGTSLATGYTLRVSDQARLVGN